MKNRFQFKSVRARLTFWLFVVALLPLVLVSTIIYGQRSQSIKDEVFDKLMAIRDLKADQLNKWLDERIGDFRNLSEDLEIRALEEALHKEDLTEEDAHVITNAEALMGRYVKNYKSYSEIFIIDAHSYKINISTNKSMIGEDKSQDPYFTEPMQTGEIYIKDIYYSKAIKSNTMAVSVPIYGEKRTKQIVGILVARIDLEHSLYDLLMGRAGMGETGETYIINKEFLALNELKFFDRAPLKLKIETEPAKLALEGNTGVIETMDYRPKEVVSAYTYIPRAGWGFLAEQDMQEIYAPIRLMLWNIVILLLISVALVYIIAFFIARNMAQPLQKMVEISRRIKEGDLSARNRFERADELGFLAKSLDDMADSMISHISVQESVSEVNEVMVAAEKLNDFGTTLLKLLVEKTGSAFGAFYLRSGEENRFEHLTSIGVNPELLEPFDASILEGELGKALATKKITRIMDIPEDTVFKFKTFTGTVLPKEIITIPILIGDTVTAVVSLASLNTYSEVSLETLDQAWMGMNTGFSNLFANEEIRRFAKELNEKNQELEAQSEELQSQAEELQQTSDELQEQNIELDLQRQQVEEANRLKSEFLSNMSHELRTPLNSVMALSRVLMTQSKDKLSEEELNYLEIIERNGQTLLSLINDILDLSKIEAGRMDVSPRFFSVSSTIEMIMERLEPVAGQKGIEMIQMIPAHFVQVESDEARVHQILQNLIGNAVKFTEKGRVTVSAKSDAENVHIEVADTGIGISAKHLPHIFEEFRQVDGTSTRPYEGTGLGLTIAHKAAKMLGGNLSVGSALGKGSTFTLTLPVKWEGIVPGSEPLALETPEKITPKQKTILIVDDEPNVVSMIAEYLSKEGYYTLTATSGKQALRLAEKYRPLAITLDILMPEMDGWEVLQGLKNNPHTKDIPVIIISVSDDKETGFALGAIGYITKPVNKDVLIAEINKIGGPDPSTIMVVDDNELDRKQMARMIEQENMKAIVADGGIKCMKKIKDEVPDVLVLDLIMPDMDGFEVLDRVRSDPSTRDLPVIVVTAKDLTAEDREKLTGNVSSVLAKSDTTSTLLLEEIKNILSDIKTRLTYTRIKEAKAANRILLVEDNEAAIIQVGKIMESEGYDVDVALNGQEALEYVEQTIPDGIILDLMMPEVDGFEVLEKIRSNKISARIPVLILTAKDLTQEDLKRLSANNIQQLIQKGDVDREGLLSKIRSMFRTEPGVDDVTPIDKPQARKAEIRDRKRQPATILVVEDNPDNMMTLKAILPNEYDILEATDGEEGLNLALTERPDLVFLDMSLPKMDGYQVVREIKENKEISHTPVIALTARAMKGDRDEILEAGCDDYISKPIDPQEVVKKIKNWLGS